MLSPIPRVSAVYQIVCLPTGKIYIGSSSDVRRRWNAHRSVLLAGAHHSQRLQRAWDKYGSDSFRFDIIERAPIDRLIEREQYYLDMLRPYEDTVGYNIGRDAVASQRGRSRSSEVRAKISAAMKGRDKSEATRRKISANQKGKPVPQLHSPEARAKAAAARRGRKQSPEAIKRSADARRGKKRTEEARQRMTGLKRSAEARQRMSDAAKRRGPIPETTRRHMSEVHRARLYPPQHIVTLPSGEEQVICLSVFCREHGLCYGSVKIYMRSNKSYRGYRFRRIT